MDKIGPEKIEIEIDYVECKYCHITTFLINEYGKCPNGCPGHFFRSRLGMIVYVSYALFLEDSEHDRLPPQSFILWKAPYFDVVGPWI